MASFELKKALAKFLFKNAFPVQPPFVFFLYVDKCHFVSLFVEVTKTVVFIEWYTSIWSV